MLAETEEELKGIMRKFRKYLRRKKLTMSIQKSNILVFEKGRGRRRERGTGCGKERKLRK